MSTPTRIFVIALLICLPISLFAQPYEGQKGDVNNDATVNILDALNVVNNILGTATFNDQEFWRADCSSSFGKCEGDGIVNILDVLKIVNIILDVDFCGMVDIEGNVYRTVTIGAQVWMAENLKVTHYRNGDAIPKVTDNTAWSTLTSGAYSNYNNDGGNVATYGRLYNWYAVEDSRNVAPEGWHVPSDAEWKQLEMHLGMSQSLAGATGWRGTDEGGKMKEAGTSHWLSPNTGATNESGFSALPSGLRYSVGGYFDNLGNCDGFWSSTEYSSDGAWYRALDFERAQVHRYYYGSKQDGFSVRCVRD